MNNFFRTTLLLTFLTLLFVLFGRMIGGQSGMTTAFFLACGMNFGAYWFSDKIVLRMYRAQVLSEQEAPQVYEIVRELSQKMNMPMPAIYLIPVQAPNAFATGRDPQHAVVAVTYGILTLLTEEEMRGVLGHELAHVKHGDILISSIAATVAGAISLLASMVRWAFLFGGSSNNREEQNNNPLVLLVMAIIIPVAATLIQLAVSRSREYGADEEGGAVCGNPLYLASALRRLEAQSKKTPFRGIEPVTAHLFIISPLVPGGFSALFSTHPPVEDRIARLEKAARIKGY